MLNQTQCNQIKKLLKQKAADYTRAIDSPNLQTYEHDKATVSLSRILRAIADFNRCQKSFDECTECGEDISFERLKIAVDSRLCVTCQEKQEKNRRSLQQARDSESVIIPIHDDSEKNIARSIKEGLDIEE